MSDSTRIVGKLGCLPGSIPVGLRDLTYYVAGHLPTPPAKIDPPKFGTWGMLGNDRYGDCGVAGIQHGLEADATIVKLEEQWPSDAHVIDYDLNYTGGADTGVVLSDFLRYVRTNKFYDHTISAYAPVRVQDVPTLHSAIHLYGFAYSGIKVTHGMQVAFGENKPWDNTACSGAIVGGHCVPIIGYDDQFLYCVTWGEIQKITYSAWHYIATEAWAVISGEFEKAHGNGRGVSITALQQDLNKLD